MLTLGLLSWLHVPSQVMDALFRFVLGIALLLTAAAILCKPWLVRLGSAISAAWA